MLTLMWNLSAAIRGYLRFYMPTNIAIDMLRTRRGLKWAVPVALVAVPAYLYAMSLCATIIERGGPGWLNVLVILFFWNAIKFAWTAPMSAVLLLARTRTEHLSGARGPAVAATLPGALEAGSQLDGRNSSTVEIQWRAERARDVALKLTDRIGVLEREWPRLADTEASTP